MTENVGKSRKDLNEKGKYLEVAVVVLVFPLKAKNDQSMTRYI